MSRTPPAYNNETIKLRTGLLRGKRDRGVERCPGCDRGVDTSLIQPLGEVTCPHCGMVFRALRQFGPFTLQEPIGQGGMGVIYRAVERKRGRVVALKLLRDDVSSSEASVEQLAAEAATMGAIHEEHVVRVFSTGTAHGHFYIAMELLRGGSLQQMLDLQGKLPEAQALEMAIQAAYGLRGVYACGILHRDVNPGNILFTEHLTAKIADFGLAAPWDANLASSEPWVLGTAYYLPPERVQGGAEDFRSDIYSLGATLFHAIAGRPPFEAETLAEVALKRLEENAPSIQNFVPEASAATAFCLHRMLAFDPALRFQSYDELIQQLHSALEQKRNIPVIAPVPAASPKAGKSPLRWVALAAAVAALAMLGYLLFGPRGAEDSASGAESGISSAVQSGEAGLQAQYFNNSNLEGSPSLVRSESPIDFDWGIGSPDITLGSRHFSVRWSGQISPVHTEIYTFHTSTDAGVRLWVSGELLIDDWKDHALAVNSGQIALQAGKKYNIVMEYFNSVAVSSARLEWTSPSTPREVVPRGRLYPPPSSIARR